MDEQPREQPVVPIPELDEAAVLSELASLFHDLKFVVDACDSLDAVFAEGREDSTLTQAYWTAAVITYIRCFTTGIRSRLTESDLGRLPLEGEVVEFHRLLKDMRDKHIAHSVNPFEDVRIGAVLSPEDSPSPRVEGVATLYMRMWPATGLQFNNFGRSRQVSRKSWPSEPSPTRTLCSQRLKT